MKKKKKKGSNLESKPAYWILEAWLSAVFLGLVLLISGAYIWCGLLLGLDALYFLIAIVGYLAYLLIPPATKPLAGMEGWEIFVLMPIFILRITYIGLKE